MKVLLSCIVLMGVLFSGIAHASGLQVSPIRLEIPHNEQSRQLWLSNISDQSIQVQVRVYEWTQVNGEEQLLPTNTLLATPAVTEILPGQRQLVRVVSPQPNNGAAEKTYRLMVEELPNPDQDTNTSSALNLLLSYSLPVFLQSDNQAPFDVSKVSATKSGNGVLLKNDNALRMMISDVRTDNGTVLQAGLVGYVLSNQSKSFEFDLSAVNALRMTINQSFDVRVDLTTGHVSQVE